MDKCMAFCQALAMSNKKFNFSLSIGKDTFNFENKELEPSSCPPKKKFSSQICKECRQKEEHKSMKTPGTTEKEVEVSKINPKNFKKHWNKDCQSKSELQPI